MGWRWGVGVRVGWEVSIVHTYGVDCHILDRVVFFAMEGAMRVDYALVVNAFVVGGARV